MLHVTEIHAPLWRVALARRRPRWQLLATGFTVGWLACEVFVSDRQTGDREHMVLP